MRPASAPNVRNGSKIDAPPRPLHTLRMTAALTHERMTALVTDIALGFYDDDALCRIHDMTPDRLAQFRAHPVIRRMLDQQKRELIESGRKFRTIAKQLASEILQEAAVIAMDPTLAPADRLRAMEMIARFAGLDKQEGGPQVVINLSTNLGDPIQDARQSGEYAISVNSDGTVSDG